MTRMIVADCWGGGGKIRDSFRLGTTPRLEILQIGRDIDCKEVRRSCTLHRCILYASVKIGGTGNEIPGTSSRDRYVARIRLDLFRYSTVPPIFFFRAVLLTFRCRYMCIPRHIHSAFEINLSKEERR